MNGLRTQLTSQTETPASLSTDGIQDYDICLFAGSFTICGLDRKIIERRCSSYWTFLLTFCPE